jgi:translation initiation factor IF-1
MGKEDLVESPGVVLEALGGGQYSILLDGGAGTKVRGRLGGKMKQKHIRVLPGDRVTVGMSPYDLTHGIITWRFK